MKFIKPTGIILLTAIGLTTSLMATAQDIDSNIIDGAPNFTPFDGERPEIDRPERDLRPQERRVRERPELTDRPERPERTDRLERPERAARTERPGLERPERLERLERPTRLE